MESPIYLIMLPDYLNGKEIPDCVDSKDVSGTKHHREQSWGQHSYCEEYSQVHPLCYEATEEHEDGVGHQVGGVQQTK